MIKKILLYISGPGVILYLGIVLFIHMFKGKNMISWMIPAIVVFFVVFLPLFAIEKFKYNDRHSREKNSHIQFSDKNRRIEWEGGNIHGKVPKKTKGPDFMGKLK
ncbi:MAG: hypothetical protein JXR31_01685 [Prolixibacteraceae bacterium]|nr:hypothetical protein [Prolixibacteraceae bacterium]MBN2772930.1 hypothetical protein [Prolixibacteraceae bacterium]